MQEPQSVTIETRIEGAKFNLKTPIHSDDINKKYTLYKRNAQPSDIKMSNVMVENRMEVLENTFLSPFHDERDAAKPYDIVSGQPVDDSIKEHLLSLLKHILKVQ